MGIATGREPEGEKLLSLAPEAVRIAIPSICYMEALTVLESIRSQRNSFRSTLEQQISQLRRDFTSANAKLLLSQLEESLVLSGRLLDDTQSRLFSYSSQSIRRFEAIHIQPETVEKSLAESAMSDPTDNLILHHILRHALEQPAETMALLTDNHTDFGTPDVLAALKAAKIEKSFRNAGNLLGWLKSQGIAS